MIDVSCVSLKPYRAMFGASHDAKSPRWLTIPNPLAQKSLTAIRRSTVCGFRAITDSHIKLSQTNRW
jgi:hypothetical protein